MSRRRGDQSRDVGPPDTGHGPVRRRTRRAARRSAPGPGRGRPRRHPDRVGRCATRGGRTGTAPFGSCATRPRTAATATRSCSRWASSGPRVSTSTGRPCAAISSRSWCRLPGYPFARQRHWVEHNATASVGWTVPPAANGDRRPAPSNGAAAMPQAVAERQSQMEATLQRIWAQCLGCRIGRPQRQLLRTRRRLADRHQRRDDRGTTKGLDLTPQDLYENQTVAALAKALAARYAEGGLARQSPSDVVIPLFRRTSRTSSSTGCARPAAGVSR